MSERTIAPARISRSPATRFGYPRNSKQRRHPPDRRETNQRGAIPLIRPIGSTPGRHGPIRPRSPSGRSRIRAAPPRPTVGRWRISSSFERLSFQCGECFTGRVLEFVVAVVVSSGERAGERAARCPRPFDRLEVALVGRGEAGFASVHADKVCTNSPMHVAGRWSDGAQRQHDHPWRGVIRQIRLAVTKKPSIPKRAKLARL